MIAYTMMGLFCSELMNCCWSISVAFMHLHLFLPIICWHTDAVCHIYVDSCLQKFLKSCMKCSTFWIWFFSTDNFCCILSCFLFKLHNFICKFRLSSAQNSSRNNQVNVNVNVLYTCNFKPSSQCSFLAIIKGDIIFNHFVMITWFFSAVFILVTLKLF